jgi:hypothetical protein
MVRDGAKAPPHHEAVQRYEALILRSHAEHGVSKDGCWKERVRRPSFETHRKRDAPQDRVSNIPKSLNVLTAVDVDFGAVDVR